MKKGNFSEEPSSYQINQVIKINVITRQFKNCVQPDKTQWEEHDITSAVCLKDGTTASWRTTEKKFEGHLLNNWLIIVKNVEGRKCQTLSFSRLKEIGETWKTKCQNEHLSDLKDVAGDNWWNWRGFWELDSSDLSRLISWLWLCERACW